MDDLCWITFTPLAMLPPGQTSGDPGNTDKVRLVRLVLLAREIPSHLTRSGREIGRSILVCLAVVVTADRDDRL
jgi:hypothetical protein